MNKEELITAIAKRTSLRKNKSRLALNAVIQIISEELEAGREVKIVGFGTFEVKERAPRTARNSKKNLPLHIPARKMPYFSPGQTLKSRVDQNNNEGK